MRKRALKKGVRTPARVITDNPYHSQQMTVIIVYHRIWLSASVILQVERRCPAMNNITDYLLIGEENAIVAKELTKLLGVYSIREVTELIHQARIQGEVICSAIGGHKGYFLQRNELDIKSFCNQMKSRIKKIEHATASAEQYLRNRISENEKTYKRSVDRGETQNVQP